MTATVSVIIPVFNQWRLTEACLHSLAATAPQSLEVLVVDNASTDETRQACPAVGATLFGNRFIFLPQTTNLNFGPANNHAADRANSDILFFLNNDTVLTSGWFPPLQDTLANPKIGAVGPRLLYPNGRVQHVGTAFTPQLAPVHLFEHFPGNHPAALAKRRCQAITAAAMLISKSLFLGLGGFYEGFRNGSEDLDLCARIHGQGLQLAVCPESVVIHHTSQTLGRFDYDDANAAMLRSRQKGVFTPDLHRFARQHGYTLRLTPWLSPLLTLPAPPAQHAYEAETDEKLLCAALEKEPLWEQGYALLAEQAYTRGDLHLELWARHLQCIFFPSTDNLRALGDTARRAGHQPLLHDVEKKAARIDDILARPDHLIRTAQALTRHFRVTGQTELSRLYAHWLASRPGHAAAPGRDNSDERR